MLQFFIPPFLPYTQLDSNLTLYHKFYLSLMLHRLLKVDSPHGVWSVAEHFHCSRGFLQNLVNSTAAFASCLVHFTEVCACVCSCLLSRYFFGYPPFSHLSLIPSRSSLRCGLFLCFFLPSPNAWPSLPVSTWYLSWRYQG